MTDIREVSPEEATGALRELYEQSLREDGYIANETRAFSLRPDVYLAWNELKGKIRSHMRLRRYELATMAAALAMDCKY